MCFGREMSAGGEMRELRRGSCGAQRVVLGTACCSAPGQCGVWREPEAGVSKAVESRGAAAVGGCAQGRGVELRGLHE